MGKVVVVWLYVSVGAFATKRPHLVVRDVNVGRRGSLFGDGFDEKSRIPDVELVVDRKSCLVLREHGILRPTWLAPND